MAAGGQLELATMEEMETEIVKTLPKLQLKIGLFIIAHFVKKDDWYQAYCPLSLSILGSVIHDTCPSPSKAPDNLKSKMVC